MKNFRNALLAVACFLSFTCSLNAQSFSTPHSNPFSTLLYGSIAWADYDRDGDMDAYVNGESNSGSQTLSSQLYRNNGNGSFSLVSNTGFTGFSRGDAAWADMDNDNLPDLAVTGIASITNGKTTTNQPSTFVYKNNGNGTFTPVSSFTGLCKGSVAWADYNNDGYQDLLVTGRPSSSNTRGQSLLYKNNKNRTFSLVSANLPQISEGEGRWGDYDNDGLPDILLTGGNYTNNNSIPDPGTYLLHNNGDDTFTQSSASLVALKYSSGDFGDYDNDGLPDIALIGIDANNFLYLKVYHNEGNGTFTDLALRLGGNSDGKVRWGDFNQDGHADLISEGTYNGTIYNYSGGNNFTASQYYFTAGNQCDIDLCDIDLDGTLDFSTWGIYSKNNYTNTASTRNTSPAAPTGFSAVSGGNKVLLRWTAPVGDSTEAAGLTYNLKIGTSASTATILSPEADLTTGKPYVTGPGNAGEPNWKWLDLPNGTYYAGVQAVDASFAKSAYSTSATFTVPGSQLIVHIDSPDEVLVCNGNAIVLTAQTYPQAAAYQWYFNGYLISGATASTYAASAGGNYYVEAKTTGDFVRSLNSVNVTVGPYVGTPTASNGFGCAGQPITLSAECRSSNCTCYWYTESGAFLGTGPTLTVTAGANSNYKVAACDNNSMCFSSMVTVTAYVSPAPPVPTGNPVQMNCSGGDTLAVSVNPVSEPYVVYWYPTASGGNAIGSGNPLIVYNVTDPVTYYAGSYDPTNGCASTSRLAITVGVSTAPAPPVTQSQFPCAPGTVTLTATPTPSTLVCKWYTAGGAMFHTGTSYTFNLTDPVEYWVATFDNQSQCESSTRTPVAAAVRAITDAPLAQDVTAYGSGKVSLFATTPAHATTVRWYSNASLSTLVGTGNNFLTPSLYASTQYWVVGYNEINECNGTAAAQVTVTVEDAPHVVLNPDQVFPVPQNVLEEEYNDVNLFTGDVNLTLPVATLSGAKLSYILNVFYNSRSAALTPYYTDNTLGGLGWKLLDYPKIAYDGVKNQYFFLDGMGAYALDTLSTGNTTLNLSCPGKYASMTFTIDNYQASINSRTWTLNNGMGEEYQFDQAPLALPNNSRLWSLTRMVDAAYTDTLSFTYDNQARLTEIRNDYDEKLTLTYSGGRVSSLVHYAAADDFQATRITFTYETNQFAPNTTYSILTEIATFSNLNCSDCTANWFYPNAPSTKFTYYAAGSANPGALQTVTSPGGARRTYCYLPQTLISASFRPVISIFTDSGHLVHYEGDDIDVMLPEEIRYEGATASADGVYFQSNLTTVTPGKNSQTPLFSDGTTSFEKGSHDDVFTNLDTDDLKKDYPLTGTHSIKFDGVANMRVKSKRFAIDRSLRRVTGFEGTLSNPVREKGSLDSLTLSFFCLQTHQTLDVDFWLTFNFYDSDHNRIDDWGCSDVNYELQNEQYGQWVPFELRFGVPAHAATFDFEFRGGGSLYAYDFYMDDVTISGTENNVQGTLQYFFFNGGNADSLKHLPDAYRQGTEATMLKKVYYTGFESGQTWSSWLDISDGPADVEWNNDQRHSSYNGTYALRVADYESDRATVKINSLPIPSGANYVLLSFHYSHPQFPGMQVRFVSGCGTSNLPTQTLTLGGSYFIDPSFTYFQQLVPVNGQSVFNLRIEVTDAGEKSDVNDFYIDDLTVQMLQMNGNSLSPLNVQHPLLMGNCYLSRTFTDQFTELDMTSSVLSPAVKADGTAYVQLKELNGSSRAAAHSGIETLYDDEGRPSASTLHWARTNPDSTVTDVWSRTHFEYVTDVYPALSDDYENEITLRWTEVSEDYFSSWSTTSGELSQWKPFSSGGKSLWAPWREFEMTSAVNAAGIASVVSGIASSAYTPPQAEWIQTLRIDSILQQGQIVSSLLSDSVPLFTQFSERKYKLKDNSTLARVPVTVAEFLNGSPGTCLYYGFESYEKKPARSSITYTESYSHTGARSAAGTNLSFDFAYNPAGAGTSSYVVSAYLMPMSSSLVFSVTSTQGYSFSQTLTIADSLKNVWRYYEWIISPPASATTLTFSFRPGSSNACIDDFRFSPVTAEMNATVYDLNTYLPLAILDNNAGLTRLLPDRFRELHTVTGPGEVPLEFTSSFYSRNGSNNQDQFNANDPNLSTHMSVAGGGTYYAMNDANRSNLWQLSGNSTKQYLNQGGFLLSPQCEATLSSTALPANRADWGLSFSLSATLSSQSTPLFGVDLGNAGLAFSLNGSGLTVKTKSSGNWLIAETLLLPSTFVGGMAIDVDLAFQNGLMFIWVNGEIVTNTIAYTPAQFTQTQFFCGSYNYPFSLQVTNISLFTDASLSATFEDAIGNAVQEQFMSEAGVVISETLYDRLNRPIIQTHPVAFAHTGLGFRESFITQMNWETGYMSGDVNNARTYVEGGGKEDEGYLYWRSIYLKSPEEKISNLFNPGYDFALRATTNWEKAKKWIYNHTDEIVEYGGYALQAAGFALDAVECVLEPELAPVIIAIDAADLIVTVVQAVQQHTSSSEEPVAESPVTNYFYDKNQNLARVHLPNANQSDASAAEQVVSYTYDFRNHIASQSTPEAGRTDMIWSDRDLLRFTTGGNDRDSNRVRYLKYDRMERVIETGYLTGNLTTQFATFKAAADVANYPDEAVPHTVLTTYVYDGGGTAAYGSWQTRGRLTACHDRSGSVSYTYDAAGNISSRSQDGFITTYSYDWQDNVKQVRYPAYNGRNFSVHYTYNKSGQIDSIFTSQETAPLATMRYFPDGKTSRTEFSCEPGKGSIPIRYYYNAPRWLTSLTAGENGSHDPGDSYSTEYFGLDLNYNVLDDDWSGLLDQTYYNGNLVSADLTPGNRATALESYSQAYQYEETGQLSSYASDAICDRLPYTGECVPMSYTFDLNGNLQEEAALSSFSWLEAGWSFTRHYDLAANRPDRVDYYYAYEKYALDNEYRRDTIFLQYDQAGNLNRQDYYHYTSFNQDHTHGSLSKVYTRRITYDESSLPTSIHLSHTGGTDTLITYTYTPEGFRKSRTLSAGNVTSATTYIRGLKGELLMEMMNVAGQAEARYYVYGDDSPCATFLASASRVKSWLVLTDQNGSAVELVDRSNKEVDASFVYDAYGAIIPDRSHNESKYSLLFNGQEYDHDAHLYLFQARTYDPLLKTFLQPDPQQENLALPYAYTGFDPVNYYDPDGAARLWAPNRKNNTNGLKDKIKAYKRIYPGYVRGDLLNMLQNGSLRTYTDKAKFIVMMESGSPLLKDDLKDLYKSASKRKKGQAAGPNRQEWIKLKGWLREGQRHEMAPVSRIHRTVGLQVTMERFQKLTMLTTDTYFEAKLPTGAWSGVPIPHGGVGSPAAHKELYDLLKVSRNSSEWEKRLALWMSGHYPRQQYRMHTNSLQKLPNIRNVTLRMGATVTKFALPFF